MTRQYSKSLKLVFHSVFQMQMQMQNSSLLKFVLLLTRTASSRQHWRIPEYPHGHWLTQDSLENDGSCSRGSAVSGCGWTQEKETPEAGSRPLE